MIGVVYTELDVGYHRGLVYLVKTNITDAFVVFIDPADMMALSEFHPIDTISHYTEKNLETKDFILRKVEKDDILKRLSPKEIEQLYSLYSL